MKIKEVKISFSRTINTGNYSSASFSAEYSATLGPEDENATAITSISIAMHQAAKKHVDAQMQKFAKNHFVTHVQELKQ